MCSRFKAGYYRVHHLLSCTGCSIWNKVIGLIWLLSTRWQHQQALPVHIFWPMREATCIKPLDGSTYTWFHCAYVFTILTISAMIGTYKDSLVPSISTHYSVWPQICLLYMNILFPSLGNMFYQERWSLDIDTYEYCRDLCNSWDFIPHKS